MLIQLFLCAAVLFVAGFFIGFLLGPLLSMITVTGRNVRSLKKAVRSREKDLVQASAKIKMLENELRHTH